ncbi:uncharacterized protein LOC143297152 [Babylonia areolata]|uniref:uncharacterized protein LOC143297152 n=1 Tax=Babylonia areolata TaxID=304850 RepID=UPI003FD0CE41
MGCLHKFCCGRNAQDKHGQISVGAPVSVHTQLDTHSGKVNNNEQHLRSVPAQFGTDSRKKKKKKKKRWHKKLKWRKRRKTPASLYYVKGSRIPVESLEDGGQDNDSRYYYPPCHHTASASPGNPCLLFLMNWQMISPLSRLAVLQRAVHCRQRSMLPVIREVASEQEAGGDTCHRGGRGRTSRASRGTSSGDEDEEGQSSELPMRLTPRSSPLTLRHKSTTAIADPKHTAMLSCWRSKSQC